MNRRFVSSLNSLPGKRVIQGGLWHGSRTEKIGDHGYNNFVSPNHENKQLKYSFNDLFLH